ncbi:MAG: hypothetical protein II592_07265, partial [Muribaculaceae bacterium]|nr:hypothetical protein [Muribaculaceae bacterium]
MKTLKKISIILGCAVALLAGSTVMQAQTLRDADYHNMGRISPNGTVRVRPWSLCSTELPHG